MLVVVAISPQRFAYCDHFFDPHGGQSARKADPVPDPHLPGIVGRLCRSARLKNHIGSHPEGGAPSVRSKGEGLIDQGDTPGFLSVPHPSPAAKDGAPGRQSKYRLPAITCLATSDIHGGILPPPRSTGQDGDTAAMRHRHFVLTATMLLTDNFVGRVTFGLRRRMESATTRMARLFTPTLFLAFCGVACVSVNVVQPEAPLYPIYNGESQQSSALAWESPHKARLAHRAPRRDGPSWYPRGRSISPRWTHVVLHHSATRAGGAKRFDKYHRVRNGWDELGYHFVIGNGTDTPDGYVEVGPRWNKQKHGAHCKTPNNYFNEHGIGICLVGDFTRTRPTPRQLASLQRLLRFLSRECGITANRVAAHRGITGRTQCPGSLFPLTGFRRALGSPPTATSMP